MTGEPAEGAGGYSTDKKVAVTDNWLVRGASWACGKNADTKTDSLEISGNGNLTTLCKSV